MHIIVLIITGLVIVILLYLLTRLKKEQPEKTEKALEYRNCPLCGSKLYKGETVHTAVFAPKQPHTPGAPVERMAHVFGCPHCYPPSREVRRICPVCKQVVPSDGHVIARMFERPEKRHVHVLGCTRCKLPFKK